MNDRYLHKAKDKDDGKWYEGYYMCFHDTTYCSMPSDNVEETKKLEEENTHHYIAFERMTDWGLPNRHLVAKIDASTICQCTGLKDKNGKLIWENDIVKVRYSDGQEEISQVSWDKYGYYPWTNEYQCDGCVLYCEITDIEVIGNIFDNPELLEVEE